MHSGIPERMKLRPGAAGPLQMRERDVRVIVTAEMKAPVLWSCSSVTRTADCSLCLCSCALKQQWTPVCVAQAQTQANRTGDDKKRNDVDERRVYTRTLLRVNVGAAKTGARGVRAW